MAKKHYETYRLYQRGETWYAYISFTTPDGQHIKARKSLCTTVREEAEQLVNLEIAQYLSENPNEQPRITLDDAFTRYYNEKGQYLVNPKYILKGLMTIKDCLPITYLDELNQTVIQDFIQKRREHLKNASINRELAKLSVIRTMAEENWNKKVNRCKPLKYKLNEPAENIKYLPNWSVAQKIIDKAPAHLKPIIYTALYTGLRKGNILNLKWENIDFINNQITVNVKDKNVSGGHTLTLPMIKSLRDILEKQPRINEFVFNYDGHPIGDIKHAWQDIFYTWEKADKVNKDDVIQIRIVKKEEVIYKRVLKDVTLPYINFHTLRHTAATWILKKTNNLKLTQQILGHSNIKTTLKYAHVLDSEKRKALESVFE